MSIDDILQIIFQGTITGPCHGAPGENKIVLGQLQRGEGFHRHMLGHHLGIVVFLCYQHLLAERQAKEAMPVARELKLRLQRLGQQSENRHLAVDTSGGLRSVGVLNEARHALTQIDGDVILMQKMPQIAKELLLLILCLLQVTHQRCDGTDECGETDEANEGHRNTKDSLLSCLWINFHGTNSQLGERPMKTGAILIVEGALTKAVSQDPTLSFCLFRKISNPIPTACDDMLQNEHSKNHQKNAEVDETGL